MTKTELISAVAEKTGFTKKYAAAAVQAVTDSLQESLERGEKVSITGFGTFEVRERGEKICNNPRTGEKITCPPSKTPVFKAGRTLKEAVNK